MLGQETVLVASRFKQDQDSRVPSLEGALDLLLDRC